VIWKNYLSNIETSGNVVTNKNQLPQNSIFDYPVDIVWKMLSDKNLITIERKRELGKLNYTWST